MYRDGIYVKQDYEEYKRLVNEVYNEIISSEYDFDRYDALNEKASIELSEGNKEKAIECLSICLEDQTFYFEQSSMIEELESIEDVVNKIYSLIDFDPNNIKYYDLFYLLKKPIKIKFKYKNQEHHIESLIEKGMLVIKFDNNWYRNALDMIEKANIGDEKFIKVVADINTWEVVK